MFGRGILIRNWGREACMCNEGVVVVHALAFLVGADLWRWACDVNQGFKRVGSDTKIPVPSFTIQIDDRWKARKLPLLSKSRGLL